MKVVIVWSSPNENGLTASAKESFLSGLKKAGTEYEEVHLNKFKPNTASPAGMAGEPAVPKDAAS